MDPSSFWKQWNEEVTSSDSDSCIPRRMMLLDSSSEEDDRPKSKGGSQPGRRLNLDRQRELYNQLLHRDYWGPTPVYDAEHFKRRFRISIGLFDIIVQEIQSVDPYFRQRRDAVKKLGLSPVQKAACAMRMFATGTAGEQQDDMFRMGKFTAID